MTVQLELEVGTTQASNQLETPHRDLQLVRVTATGTGISATPNTGPMEPTVQVGTVNMEWLVLVNCRIH